MTKKTTNPAVEDLAASTSIEVDSSKMADVPVEQPEGVQTFEDVLKQKDDQIRELQDSLKQVLSLLNKQQQASPSTTHPQHMDPPQLQADEAKQTPLQVLTLPATPRGTNSKAPANDPVLVNNAGASTSASPATQVPPIQQAYGPFWPPPYFPHGVPPGMVSQQDQPLQQPQFPYLPPYFNSWVGYGNPYQSYPSALPLASTPAQLAGPSTNAPLAPPISTPVLPSEDRLKKIEEAIALLAKKKDPEESNVIKRLRPLAEEVYDEVLPDKYKRPIFTKFDGNGNPWDHITIFEIECGSIASNNNLKLQQFPSSLTGNAMRWFNNRPHNSILTWEEMVQQFTAHFQSMEVPVKLEHLKLCKREKDECFVTYFKLFRTLSSQLNETSQTSHIYTH